MQAQRFRLTSGDIATISPGVLEMEIASSRTLETHALAGVRAIRRDGNSIRLETPTAGTVTLAAQSADDAIAMESALRTAILAAPDGGWDDLFATDAAPDTPAPAPAPALTPAPASPSEPMPISPPPSPPPTPQPHPVDADAWATAPRAVPSTAAVASSAVVLASGYRVEVTPQQVIVRHHLGHAVSDLPLGQVLAAGRSERTVTLQTSAGEVNLVAANAHDAERLLSQIEVQRGQPGVPGMPSGSRTAVTSVPAAVPATAAASAGAGAAAGTWAAPGTPSALPVVEPLQMELPSGYGVAVTSGWIVVYDPNRAVESSLPMAEVIAATSSDDTVSVRTVGTLMNFITASRVDARHLAATINAYRQQSPHPLPVPSGARANSHGIPTWAIVLAIIVGFMIFSNLFN